MRRHMQIGFVFLKPHSGNTVFFLKIVKSQSTYVLVLIFLGEILIGFLKAFIYAL
jgi:hypothetical protein